jgi:hypothetical protein
MDESPSGRYVVDLTHVVEACEFAASVLAAWWRERRRGVALTFRPGTAEHARLLASYGLELEPPAEASPGALAGWGAASGVLA